MSDLSTCVLCPRLCRTACPVATGSAREAATPTAIASVLWDYHAGRATRSLAIAASTLCVDCGACQDLCHLDRPLPQLLRDERLQLLPPPSVAPVTMVTGEGRYVAAISDDRDWTAALAAAVGESVRRWETADRFGVAAVSYSTWNSHAQKLRDTVPSGCVVVTADGGVAQALRAAGVDYLRLGQLVEGLDLGCGSCVVDGPKPLACCGGAPPLIEHHPEDAARMARAFSRRAGSRDVRDARCRVHMVDSGCDARDPVDRLLDSWRR